MVKFALAFIAQDLVSLVYLQKFMVVRGICVCIRVILLGQFVIRFPDLGLRSISRNGQYLVIIFQIKAFLNYAVAFAGVNGLVMVTALGQKTRQGSCGKFR